MKARNFVSSDVTEVCSVTTQAYSPRGPQGQLLLKSNPLAYSRYNCWHPKLIYYDQGVMKTSRPKVRDPRSSMPTAVNDALNQAINDASRKLYGQLSDKIAEYSESILTLNQTFGMVDGKLKWLLSTFRAIKRRDFRGLRKLFKKSSGNSRRLKRLERSGSRNVLEFAFGWAPAVEDIKTLLQLPVPSPILRAKSHAEGKYFNVIVLDGDHGYWDYVFTTRETQRWNVRCTATAELRVVDTVFRSMQSYGLTNMPLSAWQLVPGSFLLDSVLNLSGFFEQFTALQGTVIQDASTTTTIEGSGTIQTRDLTASMKNQFYRQAGSPPTLLTPRFAYSGGSGRWETKTKNRTTSLVGHFYPSFRLPDLSPGRCLTTLALIRTVLMKD